MSSAESLVKSDRFNHPKWPKAGFPHLKTCFRSELRSNEIGHLHHLTKNTSLSSNRIFYLLDTNKYSLIQQRDVTYPTHCSAKGVLKFISLFWIKQTRSLDPNVKQASSLTGLLDILGWDLVHNKKVQVKINETEHKTLASERVPLLGSGCTWSCLNNGMGRDCS